MSPASLAHFAAHLTHAAAERIAAVAGAVAAWCNPDRVVCRFPDLTDSEEE